MSEIKSCATCTTPRHEPSDCGNCRLCLNFDNWTPMDDNDHGTYLGDPIEEYAPKKSIDEIPEALREVRRKAGHDLEEGQVKARRVSLPGPNMQTITKEIEQLITQTPYLEPPEAIEPTHYITEQDFKLPTPFYLKPSGLKQGYPDDNPKTQIGLTKPALSVVPPVAMYTMAAAMADGKTKYGLMNWREHNVTASVYYDACMRHLQAFWDGQNVADDSGVHHLGHAMACLGILVDAQSLGKLNDDRPLPGGLPEFIINATKGP